MKVKCFYEDTPKTNILAIYDDLSGANYFSIQKNENTWFGKDVGIVDFHWFTDSGYLWFMEDKE